MWSLSFSNYILTFICSFVLIRINFEIRTNEIDAKRVKLWTWDTAGQEWFRTITTASVFFRLIYMIRTCLLFFCWFIYLYGNCDGIDHKYDDVLNCDFGEEQQVFGEAINLILRTPEERIEDCHLYVRGIYISLLKIFWESLSTFELCTYLLNSLELSCVNFSRLSHVILLARLLVLCL